MMMTRLRGNQQRLTKSGCLNKVLPLQGTTRCWETLRMISQALVSALTICT